MNRLFDLSGTVAVVTGASRGIGFGIARHFIAAGASVCVGGLDRADTDRAVDELTGVCGAGRVAGLAGDISAATVAQHLIGAALDRFGRLDTVVCNAGIDIIKDATAYEADEWDRVLSVNLRGAFLPAQAAARSWIDRSQRGGSIIFTSSIAAKSGIAGLAPYSASKGGIDQLTRALAVEWASHGIRVNAVAPGYVENVMAGVTVHADPAMETRIRAATPLERRATIDEIAAPFVFLASSAASYITGAVLPVDGGYTAL